jgi:small membrane protein
MTTLTQLGHLADLADLRRLGSWFGAQGGDAPAMAVPFSEQPLIRVIILSGLAAIGYLVFVRRNRLPFHIVTVFALLGAGAAAVMFPGATDDIAHYVGVGRGVDLITYILELAVIYVLIHYYTKFVELQRQQTQLTRELAILKAELDRVTQRAAPGEPRSDGTAAGGSSSS